MPRALDPTKLQRLFATGTKPIVLVKWFFTGTEENLSASGPVVFDGQTYTAGGIEVPNISNGKAATLSMFATPDRFSQMVSGTWRGGQICQVFMVPGDPDDEDNVFVASDGLLVVTGVIDSAQRDRDRIIVKVVAASSDGKFLPNLTFNELSSHTPPAGTILEWEGEAMTLGARD